MAKTKRSAKRPAKKTRPAKRRNATEATMRNVRAGNGKDAEHARRLTALESAVAELAGMVDKLLVARGE